MEEVDLPASIASSSPTAGWAPMPRALQLSHWTVENELAQLQTFGFMLPLIFLMVAAFILNVALTRALALQRPQIAALKALGYGNTAIGWHYLKWALAIGAGGVVIGILGGASLGDDADRDVQRASSAFPHWFSGAGACHGGRVHPDADGRRRRRVRRSSSCGARAAGGGHATGSARAVPPDRARNAVRRPSPRQRRTHGAAQRHPPSAACGCLGVRHRLRGGDPDDRLRLHRRHRTADTDAVLGGGAAGRDRQLRRAARAAPHGTRWRVFRA